VTGFNAPKSWPKELTQKWKVTVNEGVGTPALVGEKLYLFVREGSNEVARCLDAATGKEIWQDKYEAQPSTPPGSGRNNEFVGPRSSPTVAEGKVVTLGVRGTLSCFDAATGKLLWRKDDFKGTWPKFFTSSSPIVVDGLCIAQLGGGLSNGAIVAYDLASGNEKWKWTGDSTAYSSPVLMTVGGTKLIIAMTETKMVAVGAADGKLLWETPFAVTGRGYNAATPIVDGQTLIYTGSGRGVRAVQLEKMGDGFVAKELWKNTEKSVQFNTPVLKDGLIYGLTQTNELFCINAKTGKTAWSGPAAAAGGGGGGGGGGGMRGGPGGFGSIVDAGPVLLALTPSSELIVFEPSNKEFKQLAKYKVADKQTHAYPIVAGNRLFVKDRDSLILWTIQ
jgi:outer membrane protein assembly factor BamB